MISGTCPDCGASRPLSDYLADAEQRQALAAALACPAPLAGQIIPYLTLHAPAGRRIQTNKLTRLLKELAELLGSGVVIRRGQSHPAPAALWAEALTQVQAARDAGTLSLPLEGHGYLTEIAWRLAAKGHAQAEAQGEARRRGETPMGQHPSHQAAPKLAAGPRPDRTNGLRRAADLAALLKPIGD